MSSVDLASRVLSLYDFKPPFISDISPSDWAEANRVMTSDVSPYPGKFKLDRTPYAREILDTMKPDHPAKKIAVMKGAQIGLSTNVIENGIGYIMAEQPGTIVIAARDEGLVKTMMETKIENMIHNCGIQHLIRPSIEKKKNSRSGDTTLSKEFPGGWLKAFSIQTPDRMRQISAKYMFLDDFEHAPNSKDAGSAAALFLTRSKAFTNNGMKVYFISTPEMKHSSNIEPLFLDGDQRRYHIPCPCCGDYITLEWRLEKDGNKAGITYKVDRFGRVIKGSVGYICQSCGGYFDDRTKYQFLNDGKWVPLAEPSEEGFYSYHVNSLYAPIGMSNWQDYVTEYLKACPVDGAIDQNLYKTFTQTVLGNTWEEMGSKPDAKGIALNTRGYEVGIIADETSQRDGNGKIVLVTCGADLGGNLEDGRIDYEIVAWSENGTPYSVDHGSIGTFVPRENQLKNKADRKKYAYDLYVSNSIWPDFQKVIEQELKTESGGVMTIAFTCVDTGFADKHVYSFIDNSNSPVVGVKGRVQDTIFDADMKTFKLGQSHSSLYILDVNTLKDELSSEMSLKWNEGDAQPSGFLNYPSPSGGKYTFANYFSHYEAEERRVKIAKTAGSKSSFEWVKRSSTVQNHLWDCRIYNKASKNIFSYLICKELKVLPSWANYCRIIKAEM